MDIGAAQIVTTIASSTTSYFDVYSPIFLVVGGLVLAIAVIGALLDRFFPEARQPDDDKV